MHRLVTVNFDVAQKKTHPFLLKKTGRTLRAEARFPPHHKGGYTKGDLILGGEEVLLGKIPPQGGKGAPER